MPIEIEAKIKVDHIKDFPAKIEQLSGTFLSTVTQRDTFFDRNDQSLKKNSCGLRLRQEQSGQQTKTILCFKGARQDGQFKQREEIECEVSSPEKAKTLLEKLGYKQKFIVEKERQMWQLENCLVCLDIVPKLGHFIEVEGPDEESVNRITEKLNLNPADHIKHSYASLLAKK